MTDHDREAFEAWHGVHTPERFRTPAGYIDPYLQREWVVWLAALAHRDKDIADLQRQLDELVGAVEDWHRTSQRQDMSIKYLLEACEQKAKALIAIAARIKTPQPKESSDENSD